MAAYDAFVSYSHAKDKPVAAALQSVMQRLGKPWYRRRALRVFRDDTSLSATPSLWPSIEQALGYSRYLVLLASPEAAASPWVNKEVAYWLDHKSADTLLIALTDGELAWDNAAGDFVWREDMPLPPALTGRFASEPKWIDLRAYRDGADARDARFIEAGADFAAAIHGMPKEDLLSQEVRQQRRALRLAWSAASSLLILAGLAGWQWKVAIDNERAATEQQRIAQEQRDRALNSLQIAKDTARRVAVDIALKLRAVHGMRTETVQLILDTARESIDKLAQAEPGDLSLQLDRAFVLRQFVQTYLDLGELSNARDLANESLAIMRSLVAGLPDIGSLQFELSSTLNLLGDVALDDRDAAGALAAYEESAAILRKAVVVDSDDAKNQRYVSTVLQRIGEARRLSGDRKGARAAYEEALTITNKFALAHPDNVEWQQELSIILGNIGDSRREESDWVGAAVAYEVSVRTLRALAAAQPDNLLWQDNLSSMLNRSGTARLAAGDREGAFAAYKESLVIARKLVAADSARVDWQQGLAISLYRLSTVAAPVSAVRAMLREAELILDTLGRLGRLSTAEQGWLRFIREDLAKLPPE